MDPTQFSDLYRGRPHCPAGRGGCYFCEREISDADEWTFTTGSIRAFMHIPCLQRATRMEEDTPEYQFALTQLQCPA